jgi:hypothetical protein
MVINKAEVDGEELGGAGVLLLLLVFFLELYKFDNTEEHQKWEIFAMFLKGLCAVSGAGPRQHGSIRSARQQRGRNAGKQDTKKTNSRKIESAVEAGAPKIQVPEPRFSR